MTGSILGGEGGTFNAVKGMTPSLGMVKVGLMCYSLERSCKDPKDRKLCVRQTLLSAFHYLTAAPYRRPYEF